MQASVIVLVLSLSALIETKPTAKPDDTCTRIEPRFYLLPHPTSCNKYIRCDKGKPVTESCPPGMLFNQKARVCDWNGSAGCVEKSTTTRPGSSKSTTTKPGLAKPSVTPANSGVTSHKPTVTSAQPGVTPPGTNVTPSKPVSSGKNKASRFEVNYNTEKAKDSQPVDGGKSKKTPVDAEPSVAPPKTSVTPSKPVTSGKNETETFEANLNPEKGKSSPPVAESKKTPVEAKPNSRTTAKPEALKPVLGGKNKTYRADERHDARDKSRKPPMEVKTPKPSNDRKPTVSEVKTPKPSLDRKPPVNEERTPKPSTDRKPKTPAKEDKPDIHEKDSNSRKPDTNVPVARPVANGNSKATNEKPSKVKPGPVGRVPTEI